MKKSKVDSRKSVVGGVLLAVVMWAMPGVCQEYYVGIGGSGRWDMRLTGFEFGKIDSTRIFGIEVGFGENDDFDADYIKCKYITGEYGLMTKDKIGLSLSLSYYELDGDKSYFYPGFNVRVMQFDWLMMKFGYNGFGRVGVGMYW